MWGCLNNSHFKTSIALRTLHVVMAAWKVPFSYLFACGAELAIIAFDCSMVICSDHFLTLKDPFISKSCIEIKIELKFYFHTSLPQKVL